MKKKKLLTMLTALVLVAVVGVGATLAYLSSKTDVLTNVFTVGEVSITLDEIEYKDGYPNCDSSTGIPIRTVSGNDLDAYGIITPGRIIDKDPTIHVSSDSERCYLFIKIKGLDDLYGHGFITDMENMISDEWEMVEKDMGTSVYDGIYKYGESGILEKTGPHDITLFSKITYPIEAVEQSINGKLKIQACAYQADLPDAVNFNDVTSNVKALFSPMTETE